VHVDGQVETDAGASDAQVADAASPDAGPRECFVDISEARGYSEFDPLKVNVVRATSQGDEIIPYVPASASCNDATPGLLWHYDDRANPTRVEFCPRACETLLRDSDGMVTVVFGCGHPVGPPF
jgi:hypothetical protein